MSGSGGVGIIIPVVAILGSFTIPIAAIVADYKRRKLIADERRAMIDKGMEPPPLEEMPFGRRAQQGPEASLARGIRSLALAAGLGVGAFVMSSGLVESFIPAKIAGPLTLGAVVLGALGLGNLVHYAATRKKVEG